MGLALWYSLPMTRRDKLVAVGSDWKWCSAAAFKKAVSPAWVRTISSFAYGDIAEKDGDNE